LNAFTVSKTPALAAWLRVWAVLTAIMAVGALLLGAFVTTFRVGMADPIWPTYPWHLLLISWDEPHPGYVIEHTHRFLGWTLGACIIVLAAGLWRTAPTRSLRWLGEAALAGVVLQGVIGGLRVRWNAMYGTELALIHGCFAQIMFCLLVCIVFLVFQPRAMAAFPRDAVQAPALRRCGVLTTLLVYCQLVLGAVIRHTSSPLAQRGHLLAAFGVVASVTWLVWLTGAKDSAMRGSAMFLAALVAVQILLGVEAWFIRFAAGPYGDLQPVTIGQGALRTAHYLVGSFIFATAAVITLQANRSAYPALGTAPVSHWEGAA
jgi:heme A synthase